MKIVASTYFLRNLRNLDFFTLDFGKTRKDQKTDTFRKLDEFIVRYRNLYDRNITKFGKIGDRISFYEDFDIKNDEYIIFKDEDIYEISFQQEDLIDMENYILDILRKIDTNEEEQEEQEKKNEQMVIDTVGDEYWVAPETDPKNAGKKYSVNQTLSREEYRQAIKEKFMKK